MDEQDEEDAVTDKALGWIIAVVLTVAGLIALNAVDNWHDARSARILEHFPERLAWWRDDRDGFWLPVIICFPPFLVIPGAFGAEWRQLMPKLSGRHRVWLLGGLVVSMIAALGAYALRNGHKLGVATADGVQWLHDGAPRLQRPWADATVVEVGCEAPDEDASSETDPPLTYTVRFPDDRSAELYFRTDEDIGDWIARVEPIDERLRAAGVARTDAIYKECLTHYSQGLIPIDRTRFFMILGVY